MEHSPLDDRFRRLSLEGPGGWAIVGILGSYILLATRTSNVPVGQRFAYCPAWVAPVVATVLLASLAARRLRPAAPWLRPVEAAAILALTAMVRTDLTMTYRPLRDPGIYLRDADERLHPLAAGVGPWPEADLRYLRGWALALAWA